MSNDNSTDTSPVLSRLYLTADARLAYVAEGVTFTVYAADLYDAHALDIAVGAHPYAAVTLSHDLADPDVAPWSRVVSLPECEHSDAAQVAADWIEWCDKVAANASAHFDDEPATDPTLADRVQAMRTTWAVDAESSALAAEVNAAA